MDRFHFICQRWLAVEEDDGKIERVLFVANEVEKQELSYLLSKQTYHKISEDHLWFSIFSRPIANHFTRVQRCTCCFVLLFLSMFINIMYYDLSTEAKLHNSVTSLSLGPFYISSQQVVTGVMVELLSLIPSVLLVQLFQRLRSRQPQLSPLRQTLYRINPSRTIVEESKIVVDPQKKKRSKLTFPWWLFFLAYGLSLILVGISILFITVRGPVYFLFVSNIWSCSSFFHTAEMLFEMTLMKFDTSELIQASPVLGPFCFSLFIFLVVFVCMSMFLPIISDSFRHARENVHDDQEIFLFMWDRFLRWTGWKKASKFEIVEARDAEMQREYLDPIENFPNKIDQLLDALNRLYMSQRSGRI